MDHSRPRVSVSSDQNAPHPRLRAFLDVVNQPNGLSLLDRRFSFLFLLLFIFLRGNVALARPCFLLCGCRGDAFRRR